MSAKPKVDWSGMKFVIAEELGETMDVIYHRLQTKADGEFEDQLFVVNHKYFDGVGGLTKLLEERLKYTYEEMPAFRTPPSLTFWEKLKKLWGFIKLTRPCQTVWKHRLDKTGRAPGHVMAFISHAVCTELEQRLKEKKETLSSRIFWALDLVVCQEFLETGSERKWISPVNMRGAVDVDDPYGNVAASVVMNFRGEVTPKDIHQRFRDYFRDRLYMGSWLYTNMARFIGLWGTRRVARKIKDLGVGVYSNMGPWPPKTYVSQSDDNDDLWGGVPPASQILPISCGVIHWKGGLAISLMIHPSLDVDLERTEAVMRRLLDTIEPALSERSTLRSVSAERLDKMAVRLA